MPAMPQERDPGLACPVLDEEELEPTSAWGEARAGITVGEFFARGIDAGLGAGLVFILDRDGLAGRPRQTSGRAAAGDRHDLQRTRCADDDPSAGAGRRDGRLRGAPDLAMALGLGGRCLGLWSAVSTSAFAPQPVIVTASNLRREIVDRRVRADRRGPGSIACSALIPRRTASRSWRQPDSVALKRVDPG